VVRKAGKRLNTKFLFLRMMKRKPTAHLIMWQKAPTILIYSLAAVAASFFWVTRPPNGLGSEAILGWLILFSAPLLFVFAYPRFLFVSATPEAGGQRFAAILHGSAGAVATILFAILGSAFWKNPLRDVNSMLLLAVPIVAEPIFLVAAFSLFIKNGSTLTNLASFLLWPYWLLLAFTFCGRFFEATVFRTALAFLCFMVPLLFAFAAGAVSYRPTIAHCSALAGLVSAPWVYWTTLKDTVLGNIWTLFNVPDRDLSMYNGLALAKFTILSLWLMVTAVAIAAVRLLPTRWKIRGLPFCERTWPAFLVAFIFLALWFSQSVMPYRIFGALDYGDSPILQILHVEKRGLQFHETCISVWGYHQQPESVSFSGNNRRLLQYRFQQKQGWGELQGPFKARVGSIIQSSQGLGRDWEVIEPLRTWNVDGWYLTGEGIGLKAYITDQGTTPPPEIVELFHDFERLPHLRESESDRKDVCFGFCYDPLSGLGALYANHRCGYDATARRDVCR
jgi:hypothetical protein